MRFSCYLPAAPGVSALLVVLLGGMVAVVGTTGCESQSPLPAARRAPSTAVSKTADDLGVKISAEAVARLGVATQVVEAAQYRELIDAVAVGVDPSPLFQLAGDLAIAESAQRLSGQALERARALYADNANGSRQNVEAAEAQATQDAVHAEVLQRRVVAEWGGPLMRAQSRGELIDRLGRGLAAIVRIDLDPSAQIAEQPATMQVQVLSVAGSSPTAAVVLGEPWAAPSANPLRPGPSLYAVSADVAVARPGWRARAVVTGMQAQAVSGARLPAQALVYAEGRAWCYLATKEPGVFRRVAVDVSRPLDGGYFVATDPGAGASVVVGGAGLLLAEELGSQAAED